MPPAATYAAALPLVPAGALPLHPARDVYKGLCPLTPRGASCPSPLDPVLLYKIAPKGAGSALTLRRTFIKA